LSHRPGQQHRGLEPYHLHIFIYGDATPLLELHIELLAFVYLESRVVEHLEYVLKVLSGTVGKHAVGH